MAVAHINFTTEEQCILSENKAGLVSLVCKLYSSGAVLCHSHGR